MNRSAVEDPELPGAVARVLELLCRENRGEVEQGAGDGRAGNAVTGGDIDGS
jgi:hypothetical protein